MAKMIATPEVKSLLRARFSQPEWAIFFEVGDGTGSAQRRWADAVAMNMYPSRGLEVHGFEIKVSRGDWLRELQNPEKSAPIQRYCNRWWIVCPKDIIHPGELPPTWGHYDVNSAGIRQVVAAPALSPEPIGKPFIAALLRRSSGASEDEIKAAVQRYKVDIDNKFDERLKRELAVRTTKGDSALTKMAEFEKITGIPLSGWHSSEDIGKAVNLILELGVHNTYGLFHNLAKDARKFADKCEEAIGKMPSDDHLLTIGNSKGKMQ
ncbi:TPA: hypothetical protein MO340_004309 [Salmonella enterica subsp. salamae serovar 35:g,m,s,t:-]|nr:hypothetical protein [Salmonella enterica subsp. salamae serovar 35:g,m,s,t:-]HCA3549779.1 hypothetical protein [Salmonella enterica subsp. salamae serovar 35:g,m,s,t:-]